MRIESGPCSIWQDTTLAVQLASGKERIETVAKQKPGRFSAIKAVKANARKRVGQPKPAKVVDDAPRTGRGIKHKPKLQELIEREE
jgi:hypothetical protein